MRTRARIHAVAGTAATTALAVATPAWAQTGGLESPSLWLLVASLAQIVGAAALIIFFITRSRPRRCPRCGQRLGKRAVRCDRCGSGPGDVRGTAKAGS